MKDIKSIIPAKSVIPIITVRSMDMLPAMIDSLIKSGTKTVEITMRTEHGIPAIQHVRKAYSSLTVLAGTVTTRDQYQAVEDAGAHGVVSPACLPQLLAYGAMASIPYLPGCMTVTEVLSAQQAGYTMAKIFPVTQLGGEGYLKQLQHVIPAMHFCPTGGITAEQQHSYLGLPNVHCIGGSWMITS